MTDCTGLSDRMPDVAHGHGIWSAAEQAHLISCADCAAEWRVVVASTALGEAVVIDLARGEARLLERLRTEGEGRAVIPLAPRRHPVSRWGIPLLLAAAASVAVVIGLPRPQAPAAGHVEVAQIDSAGEDAELSEPELQAVLNAWDDGSDEQWNSPTPRLGELTEEQLQLVLHAVESGT